MFEDKCKELRNELKEARDEVERLNTLLADMVPRAELLAARKVRSLPIYVCMYEMRSSALMPYLPTWFPALNCSPHAR